MLKKIKDKPIIINLDIDGLLSGFLLQKYLKCTIVGFSNSGNAIWLQENFNNKKNVVFVDLFVNVKNVTCIDQHIVAINQNHYNKLVENSNKINPNLLNQRTFLPNSSYYQKYPFGTIHFIIALLEREGINLDLNLFQKIHDITLIDLILRADDCLKTSINSNYIQNANQWWKWLKKFSNQGQTILKLFNYTQDYSPKKVFSIKNKIKNILMNNPYYCISADGGLSEIIQNKKLKQNVKTYFNLFGSYYSININDLDVNYVKTSYQTERFKITNNQIKSLLSNNSINEKKIFTYAFIRSNNSNENFSCTYSN